MAPAADQSIRNKISSEAVLEATGHGWQEWLEILDAEGAADLDHKQLVAHLEQAHPEVDSGWWRQTLAVGYEQARGKRVVGQTAGAGFQVGVQRSVSATVDDVWEVLISRPELWLGAGVDLEQGADYEVPGGSSGQIRVVKPGDRLRLTWQPPGWEAPATVQIALTKTGSGKTAIQAHLEKLPDADSREQMRAHWRDVLTKVVNAL